MKKYIHYCWFGPKPLPKLAKKCIASWKKYLPDYEIIRWSEENVNLDECKFIRDAYDNKMWAFVADYARTKALNEMGGIYFDTDVEVTKKIDDLLEKGSFLGVEDSGKVNSAVWYEKDEKGYLSSELLKKYRSIDNFSKENAPKMAIPLLITEILKDIGFDNKSRKIQKLKHNIYIYPRDYFYPYSYNWENNKFTDNTCMIHYYDATWIPFKERVEINLVRKIGRKNTRRVLGVYRGTKNIGRVVLYPVVKRRRKKALITEEYLNNIERSVNEINNFKDKDYIAIHNGTFFGVTSATKELFENTVDVRDLYRRKDIKKVGNAIIKNNIKQVIFSAMSIGNKDLILYLKRKRRKIKIKVFWHGSISQVNDNYGWQRNLEIIELMRKKKIKTFGICKESMEEFYKKQKLNTKFITNKVDVDYVVDKKIPDKKEIRVGLYAAKCDDWRKNMFTQLAAISLIPNAVVDMVPLNDTAISFAKILGLKIEGIDKSLPRQDLIKRMAHNDINLYVTYSECSPMLPLESMEIGVPCITGNNHHYFKNSDLEKYLVVFNESDPELIKDKMLSALKDKSKIIKLYKEFSIKNKNKAKKQLEEFLNE